METGEVGDQAAGDGIAHALDADRAEVDRQHIERGFGAALDDAGQPPGEGIGALACMVSIIMARAPEPDSGFISMVGRPSTQAGVETQRGDQARTSP
jgi:hypothetical protein